MTSFVFGSLQGARLRQSAYMGSIRSVSDLLSIRAWTFSLAEAEGPPMEQSKKNEEQKMVHQCTQNQYHHLGPWMA